MHKGKITMLGRIMAGSQGVIAHDDTGQAVFVAYIRPTSMCLKSFWPTASKWRRQPGALCFVLDRAVQFGGPAHAFHDQDWGCCVCSMNNEHKGLGSLRPPWWTSWRMVQRSIVDHGKSAAKMIPATL